MKKEHEEVIKSLRELDKAMKEITGVLERALEINKISLQMLEIAKRQKGES